MDFLNELSTCELVALASILSISVASNLTESELTKLSAFFTAFGDNLAILALSESASDTKPLDKNSSSHSNHCDKKGH